MYCKYCGRPLTDSVCEYCGQENKLTKHSDELDDLLKGIPAVSVSESYKKGFEEGHSKGFFQGRKYGYEEGRKDGFTETTSKNQVKPTVSSSQEYERKESDPGKTGEIRSGKDIDEELKKSYTEGYRKGLSDGYNNGIAESAEVYHSLSKRRLLFFALIFVIGVLLSGIIFGMIGKNAGVKAGKAQTQKELRNAYNDCETGLLPPENSPLQEDESVQKLHDENDKILTEAEMSGVEERKAETPDVNSFSETDEFLKENSTSIPNTLNTIENK